MGEELAVVPSRTPLALPQPSTIADLKELAAMVAKSGLVPKDFRDKPEDCLIAIAMGAEVGLKWPSALQSIAVINGRPSIWGDAALALVMAHPAFESIDENESDNATGVCVLKRRGMPARRQEFSLEMARTAGLLNKDTYKQHQGRMLQRRARARAMADLFPDALKGLSLREEIEHVIEGEVIHEDAPLKTGADAVKKKLEERKSKGTADANVNALAPATGAVSLQDVQSAYKRAVTPEDIRRADMLGTRLGTEPDRIAARSFRSQRISELAEAVDADTGEITQKG